MTTLILSSTYFYQEQQQLQHHDTVQEYYYDEHPEQQQQQQQHEHLDDLVLFYDEQPHLVRDNDSSYSSSMSVVHEVSNEYSGTQPLHNTTGSNDELPPCPHDKEMMSFPQLYSEEECTTTTQEYNTNDDRMKESNSSCFCSSSSTGIIMPGTSAQTLLSFDNNSRSNGSHHDDHPTTTSFPKQKSLTSGTLVLSPSISNLQKYYCSDDDNNYSHTNNNYYNDISSHKAQQKQHLHENGHKHSNHNQHHHHGEEKSLTVPPGSISSSLYISSSLSSSSNSSSGSYPTTIIPSSSSSSYVSNIQLLTDHMQSQQQLASLIAFQQRTNGTSTILLQDAKPYLDYVNFNDNLFDDDNYNDYDDDGGGSWCYDDDDDDDNVNDTEEDEKFDYLDLEVGKNETNDRLKENDSKTVKQRLHSDDKSKADGPTMDVLNNEQLVTASQEHNTQFEPTRRQHVKFVDVCMVVEIPHYTDYTIEELDQMYTDSNMIHLLAERNVYEVRYEYELQQQRKQLTQQQQQQQSQDKNESEEENQIRAYLDEEDYFTCYKDDSTRILLHPAHVAHVQLVGTGRALNCSNDARHYDMILSYHPSSDNNTNNFTTEIRWCCSKEEMSMHSPVFLFPEEELFRQQILTRSLLQELMLGLV